MTIRFGENEEVTILHNGEVVYQGDSDMLINVIMRHQAFIDYIDAQGPEVPEE